MKAIYFDLTYKHFPNFIPKMFNADTNKYSSDFIMVCMYICRYNEYLSNIQIHLYVTTISISTWNSSAPEVRHVRSLRFIKGWLNFITRKIYCGYRINKTVHRGAWRYFIKDRSVYARDHGRAVLQWSTVVSNSVGTVRGRSWRMDRDGRETYWIDHDRYITAEMYSHFVWPHIWD